MEREPNNLVEDAQQMRRPRQNVYRSTAQMNLNNAVRPPDAPAAAKNPRLQPAHHLRLLNFLPDALAARACSRISG